MLQHISFPVFFSSNTQNGYTLLRLLCCSISTFFSEDTRGRGNVTGLPCTRQVWHVCSTENTRLHHTWAGNSKEEKKKYPKIMFLRLKKTALHKVPAEEFFTFQDIIVTSMSSFQTVSRIWNVNLKMNRNWRDKSIASCGFLCCFFLYSKYAS